MSQLLIHSYLNDIGRIQQASGTSTEGVTSEAFKDLLKAWSKQNGLVFINQYEFISSQKTRIRPDGTILYGLRVPFGYWEAKDTADQLDDEVRKKLRKGYPQDNIIFENSHTAILIQDRREVMRCMMADVTELSRLLNMFFSWERPEISEFRKAVQQFKIDLPFVLGALRTEIDSAYAGNLEFKNAADDFLSQAKNTINPSISEADIREMLIQHILTEDIFAHVFNEGDFHRENNVAKALYRLEAKFFVGGVKRDTLRTLEPYYSAIRANAAQIGTHSEKQTFLKVIYENFYKVYNPKAADRLGVVYTPNEVVRFMINGADCLTHKHFAKSLIDRNVEILDPATGTGTFICELIQHFRGQPSKLDYKYKNELHANEAAILPYYVANLNIEATFAAITGKFTEFPNLCFVDTLDNTAGLGIRAGHQHDLFGAMSAENVERIKRQNGRKISVVIGNPPYNANQQSENDNNKNRTYPTIDKAIKATYIKESTAKKTKLYDMYARFFRWASDRMHDDGVLALITNRSFIDKRTFDGFRKVVADEFCEIYVLDLGGDVRANPKLSGTKHNVFGIQTGVAISFLVKRRDRKNCKIYYARRPEFESAEDKLSYLGSTAFSDLKFDAIDPDPKGNWLEISDTNWDELLPVADRATKAAKKPRGERAIFKLFSNGVVTSRDDWVYGFAEDSVAKKVEHLIAAYNADVHKFKDGEGKIPIDDLDTTIKWSRAVKRDLIRHVSYRFDRSKIIDANYRPFVKKKLYRDDNLNEMPNMTRNIFGYGDCENIAISLMGDSSGKPYFCLAIDTIPDFNFVSPASGGTQILPLYSYSSLGERSDNITDWALRKFRSHYAKPGRGEKSITKEAIFFYVLAVLHDPNYRAIYAKNLVRDLPHVPLYPTFWTWSAWGKKLVELQSRFESVTPWNLQREDVVDQKARSAGVPIKVILKADKEQNSLIIDAETRLKGVPKAAWKFQLGSRSAVEWVLDQYKEPSSKHEALRNVKMEYSFADYKHHVIQLLSRVVSVSVACIEIMDSMKALSSTYITEHDLTKMVDGPLPNV